MGFFRCLSDVEKMKTVKIINKKWDKVSKEEAENNLKEFGKIYLDKFGYPMPMSALSHGVVLDCHYCQHCFTIDPECKDFCECGLDLGFHIDDPLEEADGCQFFGYDDRFPKT